MIWQFDHSEANKGLQNVSDNTNALRVLSTLPKSELQSWKEERGSALSWMGVYGYKILNIVKYIFNGTHWFIWLKLELPEYRVRHLYEFTRFVRLVEWCQFGSRPFIPLHVILKDYSCDNRRFWLSAPNCQVPTPTSQNLATRTANSDFWSGLTHQLLWRLKSTILICRSIYQKRRIVRSWVWGLTIHAG